MKTTKKSMIYELFRFARDDFNLVQYDEHGEVFFYCPCSFFLSFFFFRFLSLILYFCLTFFRSSFPSTPSFPSFPLLSFLPTSLPFLPFLPFLSFLPTSLSFLPFLPLPSLLCFQSFLSSFLPFFLSPVPATDSYRSWHTRERESENLQQDWSLLTYFDSVLTVTKSCPNSTEKGDHWITVHILKRRSVSGTQQRYGLKSLYAPIITIRIPTNTSLISRLTLLASVCPESTTCWQEALLCQSSIKLIPWTTDSQYMQSWTRYAFISKFWTFFVMQLTIPWSDVTLRRSLINWYSHAWFQNQILIGGDEIIPLPQKKSSEEQSDDNVHLETDPEQTFQTLYVIERRADVEYAISTISLPYSKLHSC